MSKIPKYIHYCWFGNKPIPDKVKQYIETWKHHMPEYKIIKWDEHNFDIEQFDYTKKAYEAKKYAFVSDVARIYALYKMGGIYLDTDVEVINNIEPLFKNYSAILGTENYKAIGTAFLAFSKGNKICGDMLNHYKNFDFLYERNINNMYTNTIFLADYIKENYHIDPPDNITTFGEELIIYPKDYFTAFNPRTHINAVTQNTVCIHHFEASWVNPIYKFKIKLKNLLARIGIL